MFSRIGNRVKILVVEDNKNIIDGLEYLLEKEGFDTKVVCSEKQAIASIKNIDYDLYLLDVQLPDGSGYEICKYIKESSNKPIIFISDRGEESNVVYGLDIGADDYVTKPFRNSELISRIKCVLRRYPEAEPNKDIITYRDITVDLNKARVYKNSQEILLTKLEYKILLMFLNNVNKLISREELLEKVWDISGNFVNDNTLSVYIKRLRNKLFNNCACSEDELIQTVRGMGYILNK